MPSLRLFPQRQRFPRFGAVVESHFPQPPSCRPSGRHSPSASLPQRQHFPRFGAVVESHFPQPPSCRPSGRHCPSASLPQRQHFPRFGAVVESPIPLRPFYRPSGRHCRHFLFPQRQQIPRFGAVVGCGFGLAAKVRRMSKRASGQRKRTVSKIDQCQNWMAKIVTKTVWRSRWQK